MREEVLVAASRFPESSERRLGLAPVLPLELPGAAGLAALVGRGDLDELAPGALPAGGMEVVDADHGSRSLGTRPVLPLHLLLDLRAEVLALDGGDDASESVDLAEDAVHGPLDLVLQVGEPVGALVEVLGEAEVAALEQGDLLAAHRQGDVVLLGGGVGFLVGVGVQGVGVVVERALGLERDARQVVEGLGVLERASRRLAVEFEPLSGSLDAVDPPHRHGPDATGDAAEDVELELRAGGEEEAEAPRELLHVEAPGPEHLDVGQTVCQGESELLQRIGPGLPDVVTRDRQGIPAGDLPHRELHHVGDEPHRRLER